MRIEHDRRAGVGVCRQHPGRELALDHLLHRGVDGQLERRSGLQAAVERQRTLRAFVALLGGDALGEQRAAAAVALEAVDELLAPHDPVVAQLDAFEAAQVRSRRADDVRADGLERIDAASLEDGLDAGEAQTLDLLRLLARHVASEPDEAGLRVELLVEHRARHVQRLRERRTDVDGHLVVARARVDRGHADGVGEDPPLTVADLAARCRHVDRLEVLALCLPQKLRTLDDREVRDARRHPDQQHDHADRDDEDALPWCARLRRSDHGSSTICPIRGRSRPRRSCARSASASGLTMLLFSSVSSLIWRSRRCVRSCARDSS